MTAENGESGAVCKVSRASRFNEAAADDRGKRQGRALGVVDRDASMRPRPMTAENPLGHVLSRDEAAASMRPRPMTAENERPTIPRARF